MEEVLFGCDIGAIRNSTKHWLPCLAVVQCSNSSSYNYHCHQCQWQTELGCFHDEGTYPHTHDIYSSTYK